MPWLPALLMVAAAILFPAAGADGPVIRRALKHLQERSSDYVGRRLNVSGSMEVVSRGHPFSDNNPSETRQFRRSQLQVHSVEVLSKAEVRAGSGADGVHVGHDRGLGFTESFCDQQGWRRDWSDEFDGEALDASAWEVVGSDGRDQLDLLAGPLSVTACRTAECRKENVNVKGGKLELLSERQEDASGGAPKYFSGAISTRGRKTWDDSTPYRVCVAAKLPGAGSNQGIWPAHWMLPDNGFSDKCMDGGEMDIMEMVNGDGGAFGTYHWMDTKEHCPNFDAHHKSKFARTAMPADWNTKFHEYAVERGPGHVAFVVDGKVMTNFTAEDGVELVHTPFYLILNTAVGGPWPGEADSQTNFPVEHVVDYVRSARKL